MTAAVYYWLASEGDLVVLLPLALIGTAVAGVVWINTARRRRREQESWERTVARYREDLQ